MRFILLILFINLISIKVNAAYNISDSLKYKKTISKDSLKAIKSSGITDTTKVSDSLLTSKKLEPIVPIKQITGFNKDEYGVKLNDQEIYYSDYRYSGDIFTNVPYGFLQDLGHLGQPNELMLYGLGFTQINYSRDGISLNNRWQNSFDLYQLQSETIDSIEVVNLTRGFLYGNYNNPVTINFYTKDKMSPRPYTRLRFYQGNFDEGYLDVLFNMYVTRRLNFGLGVTVNGIDSRFKNSDYESWRLNGKIGYMFSNSLNVTASYYYVRDSVQLNGGVIDPSMNDYQTALVYYPNRYQRTTRHQLDVKILGNYLSDSPTDITIYYRYNLQEFRQDKDSLESNIPVIIDNNSYNVIGINIRQYFNTGWMNLDVIGNYEGIDYTTDILKENTTDDMLSLSGKIQFNITDSKFIPTAYAKYIRYNNTNYFGFGGDVNVNLNDQFKLFGGLSFYNKLPSILERQYFSNSLNNGDDNIPKSKVSTLEIGAQFDLKYLNGSVSYFSIKNDNALNPVIDQYSDTLLINEVGYFQNYSLENRGINLLLNLKIWKILLNANGSYYFLNSNNVNYSLPEFTFAGGIYFIDTLFNSNLKFKTGVNFRYTGNQPFFTYDFEKSLQSRYSYSQQSGLALLSNDMGASSYQIDLFLSATIQDRAIIFFVYENILNNQYFIVPNYFKQQTGIRFGLSWELFD